MIKSILALLCVLVCGCAEYQSHVDSRTDEIDVWVKDDSGGGKWVHTVVYKSRNPYVK